MRVTLRSRSRTGHVPYNGYPHLSKSKGRLHEASAHFRWEDFVDWKPPTGGDETLGVVDFSIFPHLDHEKMPDNSMANAAKWAAALPVPGYAIDDQTAIKVTDGAVEVVSEGHSKLFTRTGRRSSE